MARDPGGHFVFPENLMTQPAHHKSTWFSLLTIDIWQDKFYLALFESLVFVSIIRGLISIINRVFPWNIQNILRTAVLRYVGPILYSALQVLSYESDPVKWRMCVILVTHWSNLSSKFYVPSERVGDIKSI